MDFENTKKPIFSCGKPRALPRAEQRIKQNQIRMAEIVSTVCVSYSSLVLKDVFSYMMS
jgi:hypothetical protein